MSLEDLAFPADATDRKIRRFDTGATRDVDADKLDFDGFIHPLCELNFAKYMHRHRLQPDGKLRDSANWTKGMPRKEYLKSLMRHVHDLRLHMHGHGEEAREPILEALAAIRFNVDGLTLEILKDRDVK